MIARCLAVLLIAGSMLPFISAQEKSDSTTEKKEKKDLPLEPGRTIDFETTEGSWISLDVAPDGRSLVFELIGDLYSLPIGGGTATRVVSGMIVRQSATILARRIEDRVPVGSER